MSFATVPVVTKPALVTRGVSQLLSAVYLIWELALIIGRAVTSLVLCLIQSLRHDWLSPSKSPNPKFREELEVRCAVGRPLGCLQRLTVVLDLDETLVMSCQRDLIQPSLQRKEQLRQLQSFRLQCVVGSGKTENLVVFLRPGLLEFLNRLARFSEIVLFSAAVGSYGNALLDVLDPSRKLFTQRLFRESTVCTSAYRYVKDLKRVGCDLRRTVIVDDRASSFLMQPRNGIRCKPFRGSTGDNELISIILPLLETLSLLNDVRPTLDNTFRMETWFKSKGLVL